MLVFQRARNRSTLRHVRRQSTHQSPSLPSASCFRTKPTAATHGVEDDAGASSSVGDAVSITLVLQRCPQQRKLISWPSTRFTPTRSLDQLLCAHRAL